MSGTRSNYLVHVDIHALSRGMLVALSSQLIEHVVARTTVVRPVVRPKKLGLRPATRKRYRLVVITYRVTMRRIPLACE